MKRNWEQMMGNMAVALIMILAGSTGCHLFQDTVEEPAYSGNYFTSKFVDVLGDYGMATVSPPQEDLRVGDLFLYDREPVNMIHGPGQTARNLALALRWGSLPVMPELQSEYSERTAMPITADSLLQSQRRLLTRKWPESMAEGNESIFTSDAAPQRLRSLHIASYVTATFTGDHINVLIPMEAVNMVLGTAWLDNKVAMVTLHGAESYELPVVRIIDLMLEKEDVVEEVLEEVEDPGADSGTGMQVEDAPDASAAIDAFAADSETQENTMTAIPRKMGSRYMLKDDYREHLEFLADPASDTVWIQVVTEVLYVRGMDISVQTRDVFDEEEDLEASELEIEDPEPEKGFDEDDEVPGTTPEAVEEPAEEPEEEDDALDPAFGAFARAQAINELLVESGVADTPNETLRFLTVTDDSVSLRRIWSRGLAIGVRGLILEVDKRTGEVLQVDVLK